MLVPMTTSKLTAFRFTPDDEAIFEALQKKLGIMNRADIMRMALRALAGAQGVTVQGTKPARRKKAQ
jgi:hypothetical protein